MTLTKIRKRDGRLAEFNEEKIARAIEKAFNATYKPGRGEEARKLADEVLSILEVEGQAQPDVEHIQDLVERVLAFSLPRLERPKLLALHASSRATSNTLALWGLVRTRLEERCDITEICLRNGTLEDCAGCPYTTCLHFGEQGGCFYGGVMVQEVYPAIREADALVLLCPNYNDALSANLTAAINRLTALYRTTSFADKAVFAIVVSGYSGGDIVACQAAGAMNMNKGFWLPANFCLLETANDKGEALALSGIQDRADRFAENMLCQLAY